MSSLEPSTFRIRSYDEYQTSAAQSYYRFHSRNLVWQADGGSVTSQTMSGSAQSSLSCSALPWDTACASNADGESSANHVTSHATNRKRQGEEGVKKDAENSGEPLMKRQRSHENCQNAAAPESAACPPEKPNAENAVGAAPEAATSTPKQSEKFAVPDDWEWPRLAAAHQQARPCFTVAGRSITGIHAHVAYCTQGPQKRRFVCGKSSVLTAVMMRRIICFIFGKINHHPPFLQQDRACSENGYFLLQLWRANGGIEICKGCVITGSLKNAINLFWARFSNNALLLCLNPEENDNRILPKGLKLEMQFS